MKDFEALKFNGTFRDYQQMVINKMETYLDDRRIHIVAAPGSGKTTLGIELIIRLNQPALILSPSLTIRNQWGERINDGFLSKDADIDKYVSYSLKDMKLITSVTYQSLHSAYRKLIEKGTDEKEDATEIIDYTHFDLVKTIVDAGIKTICLDEAHHLRSEWYKSLVAILDQFKEEFTIIALTATPPYDSEQNEWNRYMTLCGEIDEEIFVPQLISQNNLCPHQDYIYFNYPTTEEKVALYEYHQKAIEAVEIAFGEPSFVRWIKNFYLDFKNERYHLFEYLDAYRTLVFAKQKDGLKPPSRLLKIVRRSRSKIHQYVMSEYEVLFNTVLTHPEIFGEDTVKNIRHIFSVIGLMEFGKVQLNISSTLRRRLVSSIGKISSIGEIARFESERMGHDLQMLVLTDYIKKEMLSVVGTNTPLQVMGAVPIFEVIRRNISEDIRVALLTGSLVIISSSLKNTLKLEASMRQVRYTLTKIDDTDFEIVKFQGNSKRGVQVITELFEKRFIDILVGTKALLGEGWDSPCVNTLIMASFVGSFMVSNQMRGRAIRIDPRDSDKVASIWHLATIEPHRMVTNKKFKYSVLESAVEKDSIVSHDFSMLKRRFKSFLGPRYSDGSIESGIERLDFIRPPYSEERFDEFNKLTLDESSKRHKVRKQWQLACPIDGLIGQILDVSEVPTEVWPTGLLIYDSMMFALISVTMSATARVIMQNTQNITLTMVVIVILLVMIYPFIKRILLNATPPRAIKTISIAIFRAMKETAKIQSKSALVIVKKDKRTGTIHAFLENASRHEKAMFANATKEMLSFIDNPKYIIIETRNVIGKKFRIFSNAYAVPTIFSDNKQSAQILVDYISDGRGKFDLVYTRSESGNKVLIKAKKLSNLSRFEIHTVGKRILKADTDK